MAVVMGTPVVDHEESGIRIDVTGLTKDVTYALYRHYKRWDNSPNPEEETVIGWTTYKAGGPTKVTMFDAIAPYNRPVYYTLKQGGTKVGQSTPVTMTWQKFDDDPWSLLNERPILRDPNQKTPHYGSDKDDTKRTYARLVVTDFEANWQTRGNRISIIGSKYPVLATDQRELKSGSFTVVTADYRTLKNPNSNPPWKESDYTIYPAALQRANLLNLLQTTRLLHMRGWCVDGFQDLFLVAGNIEESVPYPSRPDIRSWRVEYQQVRDPSAYHPPRWAVGYGDFIDLAGLGTDFNDLSTKAETFEALAAAVDPITGPMLLSPRESREWL